MEAWEIQKEEWELVYEETFERAEEQSMVERREEEEQSMVIERREEKQSMVEKRKEEKQSMVLCTRDCWVRKRKRLVTGQSKGCWNWMDHSHHIAEGTGESGSRFQPREEADRLGKPSTEPTDRLGWRCLQVFHWN